MKILSTVIISAILGLSCVAQDVNEVVKAKTEIKPYYQGTIEKTENSGGYTYLLIKEKTPGYNEKELKSFWIAVTRTEAKNGDYVRFRKELVMKDFQSKSLKKTFPEIMFASGLEYRVSN